MKLLEAAAQGSHWSDKKVTVTSNSGSVHGPFTAAESNRVWTDLDFKASPHTLVRVSLRFWAHGSWCADTYAAVDVDGDTIFAHGKHGTGTDEVFRDSLADGPLYGSSYVHPLANPRTPSITSGFSARRYWTKTSPGDHPVGSEDLSWRVWNVDATVPHADDTATISVRFTGGASCSSALWAFDKVKITYSDVTSAPFRPFNFAQIRNRLRVQQDMHSWIQLDTPELVTQPSFLAFSFKAVTMGRSGRQFLVNLIDLEDAKKDPNDGGFRHAKCLSQNSCASTTGCTACRPANTYYRVCYWNQFDGSGVSGCDESHFPTYNVWHDETISPSDKFASIYDRATAFAPRKLRIQFLFFGAGGINGGRDSEFEVHLDNIRVATPTAFTGTRGCGDIEMSSHTVPASGTHAVTLTVKDSECCPGANLIKDGEDTGNDGFCYVHIPHGFDPKKLTEDDVKCTSGDVMGDFVNGDGVAHNDRVFLASFGKSVTCSANKCIKAFMNLGGVGVSWKTGSSVVLLGRKGAQRGSLPMRLELINEGPVRVSNVILCPDITASISESITQHTAIGPPLGLLNPASSLEATFQITTDSGGYVGCFRDKYNSRAMGTSDFWYRNNFGSDSITPATCAWMCREKGFTLSANDWYSHHCSCGDTYGSYSCDSHGHCGLPKLEDSRCMYRCEHSDMLQSCGGHYYHPRSVAVYRTTGERYILRDDINEIKCTSQTSQGNCNKIYDGRRTDRYKSKPEDFATGKTPTVELHLKTPQLVSALRIIWYSGTRNRANKLKVRIKGPTDATFKDVASVSELPTSTYQTIRFARTEATAIEIEFTEPEPSGTVYEIEEMLINYYESELQYFRDKKLAESKLLSPEKLFSASLVRNNLTMLQGGPQFFVKDYFIVTPKSGQVVLRNLFFDYEAVAEYNIVVAAFADGYDSGWFEMSAQQGLASYKELTHNMGGLPGVAYILTRSQSSGYIYPGIGTIQADEAYAENYGGLVYSLSANRVRMYMPSATKYFTTGFAVNINVGWGGPAKGESRTKADVRVLLRPSRPPDFDSGWFQMKSNDPETSYVEKTHGLSHIDITYAQVKVYYRSKKDGSEHEAFAFPATGTQQSDASGGRYGGVLYAYNNNVVRLWAPNYAGSKRRLFMESFAIRSSCSEHSYYCHDGSVDGKQTVIVKTIKTEVLEKGDVMVFKDTAYLDGEQTVEYVIDPYTFITSATPSKEISRRYQTVTTNASNIDEVQAVRLFNGNYPISTDDHVSEQQTFKCDASDGSFKLTLVDDMDPEQQAASSITVPFDATPEQLKELLEGTMAGPTSVDVNFMPGDAASAEPPQTTVCYPRKGHGPEPLDILITFKAMDDRSGDIHELEIDSSELPQAVNEKQTIKTLGGSSTNVQEVQTITCKASDGQFAFEFLGEITNFMSAATVDRATLKTELELLTTLGTVTISNGATKLCGAESGEATDVTFNADTPHYAGKLPQVLEKTDHDTDKIVANAVQKITTISTYGGTETTESQNFFCKSSGGTFQLNFNDEAVSMNFDSTKDQLKTKLQETAALTKVTVSGGGSATVCSAEGTWTKVTFDDASPLTGNLPALVGVSNNLNLQEIVEIAVSTSDSENVPEVQALRCEASTEAFCDNPGYSTQAACENVGTWSTSCSISNGGRELSEAACIAAASIWNADGLQGLYKFTLSFNGQTTVPLTGSDTLAELKAALTGLNNINTVDVESSNIDDVLCPNSDSGGIVKITFRDVYKGVTGGDLPALVLAKTSGTATKEEICHGASNAAPCQTDDSKDGKGGAIYGDFKLSVAGGSSSQTFTVVSEGPNDEWDLKSKFENAFGATNVEVSVQTAATESNNNQATWKITFKGNNLNMDISVTKSDVNLSPPTSSVTVTSDQEGGSPTLTICTDGEIGGVCAEDQTSAGGISVKGQAPLSGTFQLKLNSASSGPIPFNADVNAMRTALEGITGIDSGLTVTRSESGTSLNRAFIWTVTFTGSGNKNKPFIALTVDTAGLLGNRPSTDSSGGDDATVDLLVSGGGATITTDVKTPGQAKIQGTFILQWDGKNTSSISVDSTKEDVHNALKAVDDRLTAGMQVTASTATAQNRKVWTLEWIGEMKEQNQMALLLFSAPDECDGCEVLGNDAKAVLCSGGGTAPSECEGGDSINGNSFSISLKETRKGVSGLRGNFQLGFPTRKGVMKWTEKLNIETTNPTVLQEALEKVTTIGKVDVAQEGAAFAWLVTFLSPGTEGDDGAVNGGNIPAMSIKYNELIGTGHYGLVCTDRETTVKTYHRASVEYKAACKGSSTAGNTLKGSFQLIVDNVKTADIAWDASAATVEAELRKLAGINAATTVTREELKDGDGNEICDESGRNGCIGDEQGAYRWSIDFIDDAFEHILDSDSSKLGGSSHANPLPTVEIETRSGAPAQKTVQCKENAASPCKQGTTEDINGKCPCSATRLPTDASKAMGTVVRFPDALDCGLKSVPCFLTESVGTDRCCADPSFRNSTEPAQDWGVCPDAEFLGQCVSYPLRTNLKEGHIINMPVGEGWGGPESHNEYSDIAEVRIQIWETPSSPFYDSGWADMSAYGDAYHTFGMGNHHRIAVPERVQVIVKGNGALDGFYFPAAGASHGSDQRKFKEYGGVLYRYNNNYINVFAPGVSSNHITHLYGSIIQVGDGWGNGNYNYEFNALQVRAMGWIFDELTERDTAYMSVNVTDANEPPNPTYLASRMYENDPVGAVVGSMVASDQDPHGNLKYEMVRNLYNAFAIDENGTMTVANSSALDFEIAPFFSIEVAVTDGRGIRVMASASVTLVDENDIPRFCESECAGGVCFPKRPEQHQPLQSNILRSISEFGRRGDVVENGVYNSGNICAEDDDALTSFQTITYALDETTNVGSGTDGTEWSGVFKVGFCDGKITMMKSGALDFEGFHAPSEYFLTVYVEDDGPLGRSGVKENASATVHIQAEDRNDPPTWPKDGLRLHVNESIDILVPIKGRKVGKPIKQELLESLNHHLDVDAGDFHDYKIVSIGLLGDNAPTNSNGNEFFIHNETGQITIGELQPNFEDGIRYDISVLVRDNKYAPNHKTVSGVISVSVLDQNDAPTFVLNDKDDDDGGPCKKDTLCRTVPESASIGFKLKGGPNGGALSAIDEDIEDEFEVEVIGGALDIFGVSNDSFVIVNKNTLDYESGIREYTIIMRLSDKGILVNTHCVALGGSGSISSAQQNLVSNPRRHKDLTPGELTWGAGNFSFCADCDGNGEAKESCTCVTENPYEESRAHICDWLGGEIRNKIAPPNSVERNLTIHVLDVNEPPVLNFSNVAESVPENSLSGIALGFVTANDPDNTAALPTKQKMFYFMAESNENPAGKKNLENGKSCHGIVCVVPSTGELSVADGAQIDFEGAEGRVTFFLRVQDNGGNCFDHRTGITTDADCYDVGSHTLKITDANDGPYFKKPTETFSFAENSPKGSTVGFLSALDEDRSPRDVLSYTVFNEDGTAISDLFEVETGNLILKTNHIFDFEKVRQVSVLVNVNDNSKKSPGALAANTTFRIDIQDVPEGPRWPVAPFFSAVCRNDDINREIGQPFRTLVFDDKGSESVTFAMGDADGNDGSDLFSITAEGKLLNKVNPLNESCKSGLTVAMISFKVTATNAPDNLKVTQTIHVQPLMGANPPKFEDLPRFTIYENATAGTKVTPRVEGRDVDDNAELTYYIAEDSNNLFTVSTNPEDGFEPPIGKKVGSATLKMRETLPHVGDNTAIFLDYELLGCGASPSHVCKIRLGAEDDTVPSGLHGITDIEIVVLDSNDAPCATYAEGKCPTQKASFFENSAKGTFVASISAWFDEDLDDSAFSNMKDESASYIIFTAQDASVASPGKTSDGLKISKLDGKLNIVVDGEVNYEGSLEDTYKAELQWTVQVSDGTASAQGDIAIQILDVNEKPELVVTGSLRALEVDILADPRVLARGQILCGTLDDFTFNGVQCLPKDEGAVIADIQVRDVDKSSLDISIKSIVGITADGTRETFPISSRGYEAEPVLFQLWNLNEGSEQGCFRILDGKFCSLKRASQSALPSFDFEQFVQFDVTVQGNETADTCSVGVRPRPGGDLPQFNETNCNRFSIEHVLSVRVVDTNDVLLDSVRYAGPLKRALRDRYNLNTSGGDLMNITGLNFGPVLESTLYSNITAYYDTVNTRGGNAGAFSVYTAAACKRVSPTDNTIIQCLTTAGVGTKHQWQVRIGSTHRNVHASRSMNPLNTQSGYLAPVVKNVKILGGVESLDPMGGTKVKITGQHLGTVEMWNTVDVIESHLQTRSSGALFPPNRPGFQYASFGEATLSLSYNAGSAADKDGVFQLNPLVMHKSANDRCAIPSALSNFLDMSTTSRIILYAPATADVAAEIFDINVQAISSESNTACFTAMQWRHRGCWASSFGPADHQGLSVESSIDRRILDKETSEVRDDIRHKCATAAEKNGQRMFAIYGGNICKFGSDLENNFFYASNNQNSDALCLFPAITGALDIYELRTTRGTASTRDSPMAKSFAYSVQASALAYDAFSANPSRVWGVYARASGIADMSNVGVQNTPLARKVSRERPHGFRVISGEHLSLYCAMTGRLPGTELTCYAPPGTGYDYLAWITVAGQSSNAFDLGAYAAPEISLIDSGALEWDTRGGSLVTLEVKNIGNFEKGTGYLGSVVYYAESDKHTKTFQASDCTILEVGKSIQCRAVPGFGESLTWKTSLGKGRLRKCTDENVAGAAALKIREKCSGNCVMWCDKCVSSSFLTNNPTGCPATDVGRTNLPMNVWDPVDGGGTSTPAYTHKGCWKNKDPAIVAEAVIEVVAKASDTDLRQVKDACARKARRESWWGFALRGCVHGSSVVNCECRGTVATPPITSYFAIGPSASCTEGKFGAMDGSASSVYSIDGLGRMQSSQGKNSSVSYARPQIKDVVGANNSATVGGNKIVLSGTNFGPADSGFLVFTRYGNPDPTTLPRPLPFDAEACLVPLENDHSNIVCNMAPGVGAGHSWRVTLGNVVSSIFAGYTHYRSPVIESFSRPKYISSGTKDPTRLFQTPGNQVVEIRGSNFGPPSNVGYYTYDLRAESKWPSGPISDPALTDFVSTGCYHHVPHKSLRCIVPEGAGANIAWTLYVDGQESVQPTTAYAPPVVHAIIPEPMNGSSATSLQNNTINIATLGNEIIRIVGQNFGATIKYLEMMRYGCPGAPREFSYDITESCIMKTPHKELVCKTAPGTGAGLQLSITVAGQTSDSGEGTSPSLSYAAPAIASIERNKPSRDVDLLLGGVTYGGYMFRIIGTNFGIEVKMRNQLMLQFMGEDYLHDSTFPVSAGGGAGLGSGRRDKQFGASTFDLTRNGRACAHVESEITAARQFGVASLEQCRKTCSEYASCRQVEYSASGVCKHFAFATNDEGVADNEKTCLSILDMITFAIPEGVGYFRPSRVIHTPTGSKTRCAQVSTQKVYSYRPPLIDNMRAELSLISALKQTNVKLQLRGDGVDDIGNRLEPIPKYPYNLGGSFGACSNRDSNPDAPGDCKIDSRVLIFKYDSNLNQPQDQDYRTASVCAVQGWHHNMVECQKNFFEGQDPRGNVVLFRSWSEPSWWWRGVNATPTSPWTRIHKENNDKIEDAFPGTCRDAAPCESRCLCDCPAEKGSHNVVLSTGTSVLKFNDMTATNAATGNVLSLKRLCGTPSNVKRFAQSSPDIIDVCLIGGTGTTGTGTWARSGQPCMDQSKAGAMLASIDRRQNPAPEYSASKSANTEQAGPGQQRLLIWGRFFCV